MDMSLKKPDIVQQQTFYADQARYRFSNNFSDPESIETVAKEFEAVFVQLMLKSMREAQKSFKSDIFSSQQMDTYEEMYDKQLSLSLSHSNGIGLAELIVKQLTSKENQDQNIQNKLNVDKYLTNKTNSIPLTTPSLGISNTFRKNKESSTEYIDNNPNKSVQQNPTFEQKIAITKEKHEFNDAKEFVQHLMPYAVKAARLIGLDPKVMIAQAALETGWGKHIAKKADGSSSYNLFGIKADGAWDGDKVAHKTKEFKEGVFQREVANFRAYNGFEQSMKDFIQFIQDNDRYTGAIANTHHPERFVNALSKAGYATDPNYTQKVMGVYSSGLLKNAIQTIKDFSYRPLNDTTT